MSALPLTVVAAACTFSEASGLLPPTAPWMLTRPLPALMASGELARLVSRTKPSTTA